MKLHRVEKDKSGIRLFTGDDGSQIVFYDSVESMKLAMLNENDRELKELVADVLLGDPELANPDRLKRKIYTTSVIKEDFI